MSDFISDKRRVSYQHAIYARMYMGKSVLIEGAFGSGKSSFLRQFVNPQKLQVIQVESLDNIHTVLAQMLRALEYEASPNAYYTSQNLRTVCGLAGNFVVFVDEANDIQKQSWPYWKRIMDAGIPCVFAGLASVRTYLRGSHPDILSRLKVLPLYPVAVEDFIAASPDFEGVAVEHLYNCTGGDMRKFEEIIEDCRNKLSESGEGMVTLEMALQFSEVA